MTDPKPPPRELFEAALALPTAERAAYLDRHCPDARQRAIVERMLEADADAAARVLDDSFDALLGRVGDSANDAEAMSPIGSAVGPFTLTHKLGEGGSSIVFRATREQSGVTQTVALKLLRRGLYSKDEQRRFRGERLALAQLRHPGIARLIEGGVTDSGVPYIALELIDGEPITDYAREQRLDLRHRLQLFVAVCRAVEAAHRALIVHRDLKPSNVLVTRDGEVKLLDFGIAKLLDPDAGADATHTQHQAMTPAYAAPEQFNRGAITTATDVYALGVLLAELITGSRREPGDSRTPSSQISEHTEPGVLPAPPKVTRRQLRGDLDNVVLKATASAAEHRYASAGAFADDIERHLAGQPVAAHPPSRWYRARKFVARHKGGVLTTVAFLLAIVTALGLALWQAHVARQQAQIAREQTRRAEAVQGFLVDVFEANTSYQGDQAKARNTTAQELLAQGARKIDDALGDSPDAKVSLLIVLGDMHNQLGLDEQAAQLYRKAVDVADAAHGARSIESFDARMRLTDAVHSGNSDSEVKALLDDAQATLDQHHDDDVSRRALLADQYAQYYAKRNVALALDYARKSVAAWDTLPLNHDSGLANALARKARVENTAGLDDEAVKSYERAIAASRAIDGESNPDLLRFYAELGDLQSLHADIAESLRNTREALRLAKAIHGEDHVDVVQCETRLGRQLADTGHVQEGLALLASAKRKVLALRGADDGFHTPMVLSQYAGALIRSGRFEEGLADIDDAIANRRRNRPGTITLAQFLEIGAAGRIEAGQFAQAAAALEEAQAIRTKAGQAPPSGDFDGLTATQIRLALAQEKYDEAAALLPRFSDVGNAAAPISMRSLNDRLLVAEVELAGGRAAGARDLAAGIARQIEGSGAAEYYRPFAAWCAFVEGRADMRDGDVESAIVLLESALAQRRQSLDPSSPKIAESEAAVAAAYLAKGDAGKARAPASDAATIADAHENLGPQYRKPLQAVQAALAHRR